MRRRAKEDPQRGASSQVGFTLIEWVVAVSVCAILVGSLLPRLRQRAAFQRDQQRIADMQTMQTALERFHAAEGRWPKPDLHPDFGGWDVSLDGRFVHELVTKGYLAAPLRDPRDDPTHHYRYFVYEPKAYGRDQQAPWYVLGLRSFETLEGSKLSSSNAKTAVRDWGDEFAWSALSPSTTATSASALREPAAARSTQRMPTRAAPR